MTGEKFFFSFTLLEVLIAVFLILILTSISFFGLKENYERERLSAETFRVQSIIEKFRSEGFSLKEGRGIHFKKNSSNILVFEDKNNNKTYQLADTQIASFSLDIPISQLYDERGNSISELDLYFLPHFQVFFNGITTSLSKIELKGQKSTSTISINSLGIIEVNF